MPPRLAIARAVLTRCYWKLSSWLDDAVQAAGSAYIFFAALLICSVIYVYFSAILPGIYNAGSAAAIIHVLIAFWLIVNVAFNYYHCIFTDPGSPPVYNHLPEEELSNRWCKHCGKSKPPFTHHCHICKRCILKMDHHCPWMHNCVGFYNYRFFFVLLLYLWIGCAYGSYMSSRLLFDDTYEGEGISVLFTFVLSLSMFVALCFLLGWHIFLVLSAQTTIDYYVNRRQKKAARSRGEVWVNEYDLGPYQNLRNTFDCNNNDGLWWLVLLLPSASPPTGDGITFDSRF